MPEQYQEVLSNGLLAREKVTQKKSHANSYKTRQASVHEEFPARCKVILKLNVDFKARNLTGMRRRVTFLPVMLDGTWRASENKSRNNGTFHKACLWLISRKGQRLCQAVC